MVTEERKPLSSFYGLNLLKCGALSVVDGKNVFMATPTQVTAESVTCIVDLMTTSEMMTFRKKDGTRLGGKQLLINKPYQDSDEFRKNLLREVAGIKKSKRR